MSLKQKAQKVVIEFIKKYKRAFRDGQTRPCDGICFDTLEKKPLELLVGYVRLYNQTFENEFGSLEYPFHQCLKDAGVFDLVNSIKTEIIYDDPKYAPPIGVVYYEMEFTKRVGESRGYHEYCPGILKHGRLICWKIF